MKILVVDPGLADCTYGIFEDGKILFIKTMEFKKLKKSQEERLWMIFDEITNNELAKQCEKVVLERQFMDTMQQITGLIRAVAGKLGTTSILYPPASWRLRACGYGKATEDEVKETVKNHWPEDYNTMNVHAVDCCCMYLAYEFDLKNPVEKKKKTRKKKA
jgi:Holliday junction resolvasome RuvABC endonuclease subunit